MVARKKNISASPQKTWEDVSEMPKEEQPYPLPEGWKWVRGKDIFSNGENVSPIGDYFEYN